MEFPDKVIAELTGKTEDEIKKMRTLMNQGALVSRRIVEDGWKVGFMYRCEPNNPADSGWIFLAGNEDEHYNSDAKNIVLMSLGKVCHELDRDVYKYLTAPIGTEFIRISETAFEVDMKNKSYFPCEKISAAKANKLDWSGRKNDI